MPGSNERALEKAKTIAADALIFDLEDAVAPDAKPLARDQVAAAVKNGIRATSSASPRSCKACTRRTRSGCGP